MSYNQTTTWDEAETSVEQLCRQFNDLEANVQKAHTKLASLKADRGPTNQELADSFIPGEDVPVLHVDEAEVAIVALKAAVDGADMDAIRKFA